MKEFKVGDWVVITEIDAKKLGYDSWGNNSSKYKIGDVVKLIEDKGNWGADKNRVVKWWFTTKDSSCGIVSALFRKAEFHEIPNVVYLKCISSIEPHNFTVGKIYFVNDLRFTSNTGFTYNKARSIHDFYPSCFTWELSTKEAYDIQEGIKSTYYPEIGDWVFTDMCNVDSFSKETCVKVIRLDPIPDEQPNFLVEYNGHSFWCYPSAKNTSFVRKAEPHEIPNGKVPELLPPDYVEAVRSITGIEKGKIYPFVNGCVIDGRYNNYEMPLNEGCSYFKPSTKEAYDKQNNQFKPRYYKCIKVGERHIFTLNKIYDFESGIVDDGHKHSKLEIAHLKDYGNEFELSTKEEFDKQNNKTEFIVGKWYKFSSYSENTNVNYAKLKELDNAFAASDWIIHESYEGTAKWSLDHIFNPILLTDLSEIQEYLPDRHVDKMPVKPVESKSKYQIAAEAAMERFKDIKIGDMYITINGDMFKALRLPEIIAENSEDCYIDCGPGYLWEYNRPNKIGHKVTKKPLIPVEAWPTKSSTNLYDLSTIHTLDYKASFKEIQPTESITNQLLNIKLNNY